MGHNEIGNGIENFYPVPVSLFHAREKARIFKRDRCLSGNGLQQLQVLFVIGEKPISEAKRPETRARRLGDALNRLRAR